MALRISCEDEGDVTGVGPSGLGLGDIRNSRQMRCALCNRHRTVFHCGQCVRNGDIVHSAALCSDRFADKQLRLMRIKSNCKCIEESHNRLHAFRIKRENLILAINRSKEKIKLIKLASQQKRENINNYTAVVNSLTEYNEQVRIKLPLYKDNVYSIKLYAISKNEEIEKKENQLNSESYDLFRLRKLRLQQVTNYIFPIKELPNSQSLGYGVSDFTERAIAEASQPAKILNESGVLTPVQIISATLPVDGDYSQYCFWVSANAGLIGSTNNAANQETVSQNPAYRISSALSYSAQLLKILAFYLDVRLPFNIAYSDLSSCELEERRFKRHVWKIQNCATILMTAVKYNPKSKHKPVLKEPPLHVLLRSCPLQPKRDLDDDEWQDSFAIEEELLASKGLWWGGSDKDGQLSGISDDDEPEHLHWDAEVVVPDVASSPPNLSGAGLMTNAAASIVSIFRGWTAK